MEIFTGTLEGETDRDYRDINCPPNHPSLGSITDVCPISVTGNSVTLVSHVASLELGVERCYGAIDVPEVSKELVQHTKQRSIR